MILMSMRDHKSLYLFDIVLQIGNIRNDKINSQHVILREGKTAVYHNNTVLIFKGSNVHTNLFQTAKWDHFQSGTLILFLFFQIYLPPYSVHRLMHSPVAESSISTSHTSVSSACMVCFLLLIPYLSSGLCPPGLTVTCYFRVQFLYLQACFRKLTQLQPAPYLPLRSRRCYPYLLPEGSPLK